MAECIFCRIANHEIASAYVLDEPDVVVIEDLKPAAPTHLLVIPKRHFANARELDDATVLHSLFAAAHRAAAQRGIEASGYRLVFNVGRDAGQSVDHVHLHVLGGRSMAWPPG